LYYAIEHELDLEMHVVPTTSGYEIVLWKVGDHTPASVKRVLTVRWRMHAPESSAWECAIAIKKEISPGGYFT
jgi:hypothetical protein